MTSGTQFCSVNSDGSASSQERFFHYILVSQLETVEAVTALDKQFMTSNYKTSQLENSVNYLMNRVNVLEGIVKDLRNMITPINVNSNIYEMYTKSMLLQNNTPSKDITEDEDDEKRFVRMLASSETLNSLSIQNDVKYPKKSNFFGKNVEDLAVAKCEEGSSTTHYHYHQQTTSCCSCRCACGDGKELAEGCDHKLLAIKDIKDEEDEKNKKDAQRMFNKRVKYEVNRKFGENYLFDHQVRELDVKEMHRIRNRVMKLFKPSFPNKNAWNNAMNSLRQDRHQLKKKGIKMIKNK